MLNAIHEKTSKCYIGATAKLTFNNPKEEKWICCRECKNSVGFVKRHRKKSGTTVVSHFRMRKNRVCKNKSSRHDRLLVLISELIENEKIELVVYDERIPWKSLKLKEIPDITDRIEKHVGNRIPDIKYEFKEFHPLLGRGIVFEVQLSSQDERTELQRETDLLCNGWSITWLRPEHFHPTELAMTTTQIEITRPYHMGALNVLKDLLEEVRTTTTNTKESCEYMIRTATEQTKAKIEDVVEELSIFKVNIKNEITTFLDSTRENVIKQTYDIKDWTRRTCRTCKYGTWDYDKNPVTGKYDKDGPKTGLIACWHSSTRIGRRPVKYEGIDTCEKWELKREEYKNGY